MASRPGHKTAKQSQALILPPACLTVDMMFFSWNAVNFMADVAGLCFFFSSKSLGDYQDVFWQM